MLEEAKTKMRFIKKLKSNPIGINIIGCINILIGMFFLLKAVTLCITKIQKPQTYAYIFWSNQLWAFIWPILAIYLGISLLQLKPMARKFQLYFSLLILLIAVAIFRYERTLFTTLLSVSILIMIYLNLPKIKELFKSNPIFYKSKTILITGRFLQIIGWILALPSWFLAYAPIQGAEEAKYQFTNNAMRIFLMWLIIATALSALGSILLKRNKK